MQRTKTMQKPDKRLAGLDGLRGIAVIAVVLYHLFPQTVKGGFLGVSLFFVLSGYLMAVSSNRYMAQSSFSVGDFYKRRIGRIYPSLMITVCITILFLGVFAPMTLRGIRYEVISILAGYNNWWQIAMNASYFTKMTDSSAFTHMWSLAVEMQFYLVWPFLFLGYMKLKRRIGYKKAAGFWMLAVCGSILALIFVYQTGADPTRAYYGTDTRSFSLLLGSLTGFMQAESRRLSRDDRKALSTSGFRSAETGMRSRSEETRMRSRSEETGMRSRSEETGMRSRSADTDMRGKCKYLACFTGILVVCGILFFAADGQSAFTYWVLLPMSGFLFAGLIQLAGSPRLPARGWLNAAPLTWIGRRSYEIYLCHYPVLFILRQITKGKTTLFIVLAELVWIAVLSAWLYNFSENIREAIKALKVKNAITGIKGLCILTLSLTAFVILAGFAVVMKSDAERMSEDQKALQEELSVNAQILEQQETTDPDLEDGMDEGADITADITAIGDSVMLGAAEELKKKIPGCYVDAQESRQVWNMTQLVQELEEKGRLGDIVILGAGSNGSFDKRKGQELLDTIGSARTIFWITVYGENLGWQESVNTMIAALADQNDNLNVIDWAGVAEGHSEWFYDDGMHLNKEGQLEYVNCISENILCYD